MENAGEIRWITRYEPQRALVIESLETIEQLPGNFQVRFHSKTDPHEFIDFFRRANSECCRSDAGERKIGLASCSPWLAGALRRRLGSAGLSFPYWQAANH